MADFKEPVHGGTWDEQGSVVVEVVRDSEQGEQRTERGAHPGQSLVHHGPTPA